MIAFIIGVVSFCFTTLALAGVVVAVLKLAALVFPPLGWLGEWLVSEPKPGPSREELIAFFDKQQQEEDNPSRRLMIRAAQHAGKKKPAR